MGCGRSGDIQKRLYLTESISRGEWIRTTGLLVPNQISALIEIGRKMRILDALN